MRETGLRQALGPPDKGTLLKVNGVWILILLRVPRTEETYDGYTIVIVGADTRTHIPLPQGGEETREQESLAPYGQQ